MKRITKAFRFLSPSSPQAPATMTPINDLLDGVDLSDAERQQSLEYLSRVMNSSVIQQELGRIAQEVLLEGPGERGERQRSSLGQLAAVVQTSAEESAAFGAVSRRAVQEGPVQLPRALQKRVDAQQRGRPATAPLDEQEMSIVELAQRWAEQAWRMVRAAVLSFAESHAVLLRVLSFGLALVALQAFAPKIALAITAAAPKLFASLVSDVAASNGELANNANNLSWTAEKRM